MNTRVGVVYDERYIQHDPGPYRLRASGQLYPFDEPVPHPSNHHLVKRTLRLLELTGLMPHLTPIRPQMVDDATLLAYHTPAHLARVRAADAAGGDTGDNARIGPGGEAIARLAVGGAIAAVDAVMTGSVGRAFALVRPPGHHAMADHSMGFCVFNNIALAVRYAQQRYGLQRILIVDWDVHAGNGTQDCFEADPQVLYISLHQDQLFPRGWGALDQIGQGAGTGFTVNLPLPAGTGDAGYAAAMERLVIPIAQQFQPELILVSAGQDASNADPLGRMCLTTNGYRSLTDQLIELATTLCQGRLVLVLEGGYAEWYAPYCTLAIFERLLDRATGLEEPFPAAWVAGMPPTQAAGLDLAAALTAAQATYCPYWSLPAL